MNARQAKFSRVAFALAAALAGLVLVTGDASARTVWQQNHPWRTEVNHRLANQNARINNELREGEISPAQAAQLHREDHAIRMEERSMASMNNTHLTRNEWQALNQQENAVSRQIGW